MRIDKSRGVLICVIIFCIPAFFAHSACAQPAPDPAPLPAHRVLAAENEIGFFGTIPVANASYRADAVDRQFYIFGIAYNRMLVHGRLCDVRWVSEIMPVELLREPFLKGTSVQTLSDVPSFTETKTTYGMGSNPVGADVIFLPNGKWEPFVGVHGGVSYFTRNVLSVQGSQFNFLLDGRAGMRYMLSGRRSVSVSYRFEHMSNAFTAIDNPGVDSQMIQFSYNFPSHFWRAH
jgi:hypothetical protein